MPQQLLLSLTFERANVSVDINFEADMARMAGKARHFCGSLISHYLRVKNIAEEYLVHGFVGMSFTTISRKHSLAAHSHFTQPCCGNTGSANITGFKLHL